MPIYSQIPDEFVFTTTNSSGSILGQVQIDGESATADDWIAAFDESGNCCGASQLIMNNGISYLNLVIYGDDDTTDNSGGFIVYEKVDGVWTFTQQITGVGTGSSTFGYSEEGKAVQLDYAGTRVFIGA